MKNIVASALYWFFVCFIAVSLSGCVMSKKTVQKIIKHEFQEKMNTHSVYKNFGITVKRVTLVKTGARKYDGKVTILYNGSPHDIAIKAKIDQNDVIWEEDPMDFAAILGSQILDSIDWSGLVDSLFGD